MAEVGGHLYNIVIVTNAMNKGQIKIQIFFNKIVGKQKCVCDCVEKPNTLPSTSCDKTHSKLYYLWFFFNNRMNNKEDRQKTLIYTWIDNIYIYV